MRDCVQLYAVEEVSDVKPRGGGVDVEETAVNRGISGTGEILGLQVKAVNQVSQFC